MQKNVFGEPLELCGLDPVTGYFRDGFTTTDESDYGSHTVCAVVSAEFLEHQNRLVMTYQLRRHSLDLLASSQEIAGQFAHRAGNKHLKMAQLAVLC